MDGALSRINTGSNPVTATCIAPSLTARTQYFKVGKGSIPLGELILGTRTGLDYGWGPTLHWYIVHEQFRRILAASVAYPPPAISAAQRLSIAFRGSSKGRR